jgi:hypothetical protein
MVGPTGQNARARPATRETNRNTEFMKGCVPAQETKSVEVRLIYQSVSWEQLKFIVENHTDDWGEKLCEAWKTKYPLGEIAFVSKSVSPQPQFVFRSRFSVTLRSIRV